MRSCCRRGCVPPLSRRRSPSAARRAPRNAWMSVRRWTRAARRSCASRAAAVAWLARSVAGNRAASTPRRAAQGYAAFQGPESRDRYTRSRGGRPFAPIPASTSKSRVRGRQVRTPPPPRRSPRSVIVCEISSAGCLQRP